MEVKLGWNELTIENTLYMVDEKVIDYIRKLQIENNLLKELLIKDRISYGIRVGSDSND